MNSSWAFNMDIDSVNPTLAPSLAPTPVESTLVDGSCVVDLATCSP
jgi:hypothetical protein